MIFYNTEKNLGRQKPARKGKEMFAADLNSGIYHSAAIQRIKSMSSKEAFPGATLENSSRFGVYLCIQERGGNRQLSEKMLT